MLSHNFRNTLERAQQYASDHKHEFATTEHLLLALVDDVDAIEVLEAYNIDLQTLQLELAEFLNQEMAHLIDSRGGDIGFTIAFRRVIERATLQAQGRNSGQISGAHILASLMAEEESRAVYLLQKHDFSRLDAVNYLIHGHGTVGSVGSAGEDPHDAPQVDDSAPRRRKQSGNAEAVRGLKLLGEFCIDLNAKAQGGLMDPLIGREAELGRMAQILCRRSKNNPLLVGDPGVGKTALVEGLAQSVVDGRAPEALSQAQIWALDMGALVAGTRYRGDFEERVKSILDALARLPLPVLFIDEIHTVVHAGATAGGAMDASNLLKPVLRDGKLRCIGSTTYREYRAHLEKDRAFLRRFEKIDILEPEEDVAIKILGGLRERYEKHHEIRYTREALRGAVQLSARFLHDRRLPDKAVDVIDEAGAAQRARIGGRRRKVIGIREIEETVAQIARIPTRNVSQDDRHALRTLEEDLQRLVFGQNEALKNLSGAVRLSRAGLRGGDRPVGSYLFSGPTGVGKTEAARQLAATLGVPLQRFDMSEYMERHSVSRLIGTPPGYVGFDQGGLLTDAIDKEPYCVLLLDEIEKAHPDIFNLLLQIMDYGRLTDHNGRAIDFRNVILILTTNAGAVEQARAAIGFARQHREGEDEVAVQKLFPPEFRNRLDATIYFKPLSAETMLRIVDKFILELEQRLSERNVSIRLDAEARGWLAQRGHDPSFGARPLSRLMEEHISKPLADALLFGELAEHGGRVFVSLSDNALVLRYEVVQKGQARKEHTRKEHAREERARKGQKAVADSA